MQAGAYRTTRENIAALFLCSLLHAELVQILVLWLSLLRGALLGIVHETALVRLRRTAVYKSESCIPRACADYPMCVLCATSTPRGKYMEEEASRRTERRLLPDLDGGVCATSSKARVRRVYQPASPRHHSLLLVSGLSGHTVCGAFLAPPSRSC